jgi:uncharacterized RmlC-like cupin family protein
MDNLTQLQIEGGQGIFTVRRSGAVATWKGANYRVGLDARNVGAKQLSMNVATVPPGGSIAAHIHVGFEVMLYILHGQVRHEYGMKFEHVLENTTGDFIFVQPDVPHRVFNVSQTEPVVVVVARSDASGHDHIIPYEPKA